MSMGRSRCQTGDIRSRGMHGNQRQSKSSGIVKNQIIPSVTVNPIMEPTRQEQRKKTWNQGRKMNCNEQNTIRYLNMEELDEMDDNVFYSLNKKKRWNIPEKIRNEISLSRYAGDSGLHCQKTFAESVDGLIHDMTLIERHSWKRGSNCISLRSTNLSVDIPCKSKTYLNSDSILKNSARQRNQEKKKTSHTAEHTERNDEPELACTEIEVSYSHPVRTYENAKLQDVCRPKSSKKSCKQQMTFLNIYKEDEYESGCFEDEWSDDEKAAEEKWDESLLHSGSKNAVPIEEIPQPSFLRDYVCIVESNEDDDSDDDQSDSSWEIVNDIDLEKENNSEMVEHELTPKRDCHYGISEWLIDAFERKDCKRDCADKSGKRKIRKSMATADIIAT